MGTMARAADHKPEGHKHDESLEECAEACNECQRECDACAQHCAMLLGAGKKEHMATLQSCQDCADICTAAARIVARGGAYMKIICMACADALRQVRRRMRKVLQRQNDGGVRRGMSRMREGLPRDD